MESSCTSLSLTRASVRAHTHRGLFWTPTTGAFRCRTLDSPLSPREDVQACPGPFQELLFPQCSCCVSVMNQQETLDVVRSRVIYAFASPLLKLWIYFCSFDSAQKSKHMTVILRFFTYVVILSLSKAYFSGG